MRRLFVEETLEFFTVRITFIRDCSEVFISSFKNEFPYLGSRKMYISSNRTNFKFY